MAFESGVPQEVSPGVWAGVTDFREFSVGAGVPAGITPIYPTTGNPSGEAIANDAEEGNYFTAIPGANESLAYILDAFSNLDPAPAPLDVIEMLARLRVPGEQGNRRLWGPHFQLAGTNHTDLDSAGAGLYMRAIDPDDYESNALTNIAGTGGVIIQSDLQEAEQVNAWYWQRIRIGDPGGGASSWRVKSWYGALLDEPAAWDGEVASGNHADFGNNAMGWVVNAIAFQQEQRIAFFSFTTEADPDANPPPEPDDILVSGGILPPDVTVDPLQATYVGLKGTPFEVVE